MSSLAVFAYGSLVNPESAALTLGRPVEHAGLARLAGWRRSWSVARDNRATEKTFARADDGSIPEFVVSLTLARSDAGGGANGALIEITEAEADRLDLRERRYDRTDVSADLAALPDHPLPRFERVITYVAKAHHHFPQPPEDAIAIAGYVNAVEAAFERLGTEHLELYRETTGPLPVAAVEATLVRDEIPAGNPRAW